MEIVKLGLKTTYNKLIRALTVIRRCNLLITIQLLRFQKSKLKSRIIKDWLHGDINTSNVPRTCKRICPYLQNTKIRETNQFIQL